MTRFSLKVAKNTASTVHENKQGSIRSIFPVHFNNSGLVFLSVVEKYSVTKKSRSEHIGGEEMEPLTKSQNVLHPASVTKKQQQQKRDQPEVGPENETGDHQMMGGNLHVV